MPCRATQDRRVMVESSDKMWSTREGNGKALQYSCLENSMNSIKRQKDMTLEDELPRLVGAQNATGEEWRNNCRKNEETEPKWKQHPVVDVSGDGRKVWCCKEQYYIGTWNVRSMNQDKLDVVKQEMARVNINILGISSVQSLSRVQLFETPWIAALQASPSITISPSSLRLMSIESVMPSSHLILCHPLLLLPSIPPNIRVFSNESILHMRWPKYWSFSFNIIPSKEIPGLISFRMDWVDLLAVQGTLRVFYNTTVQKHQIFGAQPSSQSQRSHPYMTTGKTIALTRRTLVGKVMSLLFNTLSRLVITFLPRSKSLLISWLQSPSAEILKPPKIKSDTVSTVSPSISHEMMGPDAMILVFWMLSFKSTFSLSSFTFIKRLFSSSSLSAI